MNENLEEVLEQIMNREVSVRKACEMYGYKRDFIRSQLIKKYSRNEKMLQKIVEVMAENKKNSTTLYIDEEQLKEVFEAYLEGNILGKEACEKLGIKDKETLRNKFAEFIQNSDDENLIQKYMEYAQKRNIDYSTINFRILAIDMMRGGYSQTDMAKMSEGIHPRTISREFEKLKNDEDQTLYKLVKVYSDMQMRHYKMNEYEFMLQEMVLAKYEKEHKELLQNPQKSKTQIREEQINDICVQIKEFEEQGFSQKQIAEKLGMSVSGIRRAKIAKKNQESLREK